MASPCRLTQILARMKVPYPDPNVKQKKRIFDS
jgi:hypothetical protein